MLLFVTGTKGIQNAAKYCARFYHRAMIMIMQANIYEVFCLMLCMYGCLFVCMFA